MLYKAVLKSSCKIHKKTPVLESPFNELAALKVGCFIKKRLQQKCFPVIIAKFLGTPILKGVPENWDPEL